MLCWKPAAPLPPSCSCHTCSCGGKQPPPPSGPLSPCCCQTCPRSFRCCFWPPLMCHWQTWTLMHSSSLALEVRLQENPMAALIMLDRNCPCFSCLPFTEIASPLYWVSEMDSQRCTDMQSLVERLLQTGTVSDNTQIPCQILRQVQQSCMHCSCADV